MLAVALLLAGCARTTDLGPELTETERVIAGAARSAELDISMGAGELDLTTGGEALLEASITRNAGLKRPVISYVVDRDRGRLTMRQASTGVKSKVVGARGYRNRWNLALGRDIPMNVKLELGAGTVKVKLAEMKLKRLDIDFGAASGRIDLSGDWAGDLDVNISGGVGAATLVLPRRVGVKVEIDGGLGAVDACGFKRNGQEYTNDVIDSAPVTMNVTIEAGIGSVNLELGE